ncbi:hypothetical protein FOCC_FOCC012912 [Frankliniella occidentalis]|nr:hypothetical protein FOCC_FOCC012912 [Frankliniella occidentalis]
MNTTATKKPEKRKAGDQPSDSDFFAKRRVTQADVDRVVDRFVIHEGLPHRIVDSPYFREAVLLGCPSTVRVTARKAFKIRLAKHSEQMETNLKSKFENVSYFSTAADGWSKHRRGFLGMTASWLNTDTMERESAALALERLKGRHTHEKLASAISKVHQHFGITQKVTKTTTDSASNFRKAFKMFGGGGEQSDSSSAGPILDDDEDDPEVAVADEDVDGEESDNDDDCDPISLDEALDFHDNDGDGVVLPPHQRCASHILNLLATVDVKAALETNVAYKTIHNSTSEKLRIISLIDAGEDTFNSTLDKAGLTRLSRSEVRYLREYVWVMQPVAAALDILQREKDMYIGYLIPTVLRLGAQLTARCEMNGKRLQHCDVLARTLLSALREPRRFKQYLDQRDLQLAAVLLPQFKLSWERDPEKRQKLRQDLIEEASSVTLDLDNTGAQGGAGATESSNANLDATNDAARAEEEAVDTPDVMEVGVVDPDGSFFDFDFTAVQTSTTTETAEEEVDSYLATGPRPNNIAPSYAKGPNGKREFPRLSMLFLSTQLGDITFKQEVLLKANIDYWK